MDNPTLKETYRSRNYDPAKVVGVYVRFTDIVTGGEAPRRSFKFFEVNAAAMTIREYYSDGRELDAATAKAAQDAAGLTFGQVKWDGWR